MAQPRAQLYGINYIYSLGCLFFCGLLATEQAITPISLDKDTPYTISCSNCSLPECRIVRNDTAEVVVVGSSVELHGSNSPCALYTTYCRGDPDLDRQYFVTTSDAPCRSIDLNICSVNTTHFLVTKTFGVPGESCDLYENSGPHDEFIGNSLLIEKEKLNLNEMLTIRCSFTSTDYNSPTFRVSEIQSCTQVTITNDPVNYHVCKGVPVDIPCGFSGADFMDIVPDWLRVTYSWTKNDTIEQVSMFDGEKIANNTYPDFNWTINTVGKTGNLHVFTDDPGCYGYQCSVSSVNSSMSQVIVAGPPEIIDVSVVNDSVTGDTVLVSWKSSSDAVCGKVSYTITLTTPTGEMHSMTTNEDSHTFTDLDRDTTYDITVSATNEAGTSQVVSTTIQTDGQNGDNNGTAWPWIFGPIAVVLLFVLICVLIAIVYYKVYYRKRKNTNDTDEIPMDTNSSIPREESGNRTCSENVNGQCSGNYSRPISPIGNDDECTTPEEATSRHGEINVQRSSITETDTYASQTPIQNQTYDNQFQQEEELELQSAQC